MKSVSRHFKSIETPEKTKLRCTNCNWVGNRTFNLKQDGFGTCPRCNGKLIRFINMVEQKRLEKAKKEMERINL